MEELRKMGASVVSEDSFALIDGNAKLQGAHVEAKELRGGAALIMARLRRKARPVSPAWNMCAEAMKI